MRNAVKPDVLIRHAVAQFPKGSLMIVVSNAPNALGVYHHGLNDISGQEAMHVLAMAQLAIQDILSSIVAEACRDGSVTPEEVTRTFSECVRLASAAGQNESTIVTEPAKAKPA